MFGFTVEKTLGQARLTTLTTPHGKIAGPFFQFVATQAAIRGQVFSEDLEKLGVQVVLANTFHLHERPGEDVVAQAGGLHSFMQWDKPITTDSGGYQVFSLANVRLDADGVTFTSPLDGRPRRLTPELVIAIQQKLGADLIMPLDVCTPYKATREEIAAAVKQTIQWAKRCKEELARLATKPTPFPSLVKEGTSRPPLTRGGGEGLQALYGIVQGGLHADLREECAAALREIGFFGYAIGGELREGEESSMEAGLVITLPHLPAEAPRYHMGAGEPEDIVRAVRLGVDHFDCVLPIRNARHGRLYYDLNFEELERCFTDPERPVEPAALYRVVDPRKSAWAQQWEVFSPGNPAIAKPYTFGYVHHLLRAEPPSGYRLAVLHNIYFYVRLFDHIRRILRERGS